MKRGLAASEALELLSESGERLVALAVLFVGPDLLGCCNVFGQAVNPRPDLRSRNVPAGDHDVEHREDVVAEVTVLVTNSIRALEPGLVVGHTLVEVRQQLFPVRRETKLVELVALVDALGFES